MSTKTLDEQLNAKADQEFDKIVSDVVNKLYNPKDLFGAYENKSFKSGVNDWSFYDLGSFARKAFEVYREGYRERFKSIFIGKIQAMQTQMESYIGELQVEEEKHEQ